MRPQFWHIVKPGVPAPDAKNCHQIAGSRPTHLHGFVGSNARTSQWGSLKWIDLRRYFCDISAKRPGILGIAAIHKVAGIQLLLTQGFPSRDTILACPTGIAEPGNGDAISLFDHGDPRPNLFDNANSLMAGNKR